MKLKITDEKLDEFMQIDFVSSGRVPTEWAVMNYKSGFQAAESYHQSKADKLTEIISNMKAALDFDYPYFAAKQHKCIDLLKQQKEIFAEVEKIENGLE